MADATPLAMANAYATVAAEGNYCEPLPVVEIRDFNGAKLDAANPRCRQAVDPDVARAALDAARCPVGDQSQYGECHSAPTAGGTKGIVGSKYPVAGKTGTTDHNRTAALIVMTKQLAIAGLIGDPDDKIGRTFGHDQVNTAVQKTMHDFMVGKPVMGFGKETEKIAYGQRVPVPSVKCASVEDATNALKAAQFNVNVDTSRTIASECPAGTVAKTAPPAGTASKGSVITLILSAGPDGQPDPGGGGGGGGGGGDPGPGPPGKPTCKPPFCRPVP